MSRWFNLSIFSQKMKAPSFENCQVAICEKGMILEASESFCWWVGSTLQNLTNLSFRDLMVSLEGSWASALTKDFHQRSFELYLPLSPEESKSSLGIFLCYRKYSNLGIISISPALAPHDKLKRPSWRSNEGPKGFSEHSD